MSFDPRKRPRPSTPQAPVETKPEQPQEDVVSTAASADAEPKVNGQEVNGANESDESFKLRFCTVCASNNNRSMEGHLRLSEAKYPVISFGTGTLVRLPGPSITQPNVYPFNTSSYNTMYTELEEKDSRLYEANGILKMLGRNRGIKTGPERWQDWKVGLPRVGAHDGDRGSRGVEAGVVDVVITCEDRCWEAVVDDLLHREGPLDRPVHVFNVDIKDSHEEALVGGRAIVDLANSLNAAANEERDAAQVQDLEFTGAGRAGFDERVPDILASWQERWPQFPALWTLGWF